MRIEYGRIDNTGDGYDEEHFHSFEFVGAGESWQLEIHDDGECVFLKRESDSFRVIDVTMYDILKTLEKFLPTKGIIYDRT